MPVKIKSATFRGIDGIIIEVEADVRKSLPAFHIVGLPDASIKEAKERVRSAIINNGYKFPLGKIIINLAPSNIKKEGTLLDLPMAISILALEDIIPIDGLEKFLILGELALNGDIRSVNGILPIIIEAKNSGIENFIIPYDNLNECTLLKGIKVYPLKNLREVISLLIFNDMMAVEPNGEYNPYLNDSASNEVDFNEVAGHESNKRALEIAAAGNHHTILFGEPGAGKTMLASRMCSILPALTYEEALETTKIYSVSGNLKSNKLIFDRPFRNPHHTATTSAIVGGGKDLNMGEITLAHNGVLYLDEILEFKKDVIEVLRQPLEDKSITLSRANGTIKYPSKFLLLASMNPCKCGNFLSTDRNRQCTCTYNERKNYLSKLSGAILDRIDIFSYVPPLKSWELNLAKENNESSKIIKSRVEAARHIQSERYKGLNVRYNSDLNHAEILELIYLSSEVEDILKTIYDRYSLTTRSYDKLIKLSRTIADLKEEKEIKKEHICEAVQYRKFISNEVI